MLEIALPLVPNVRALFEHPLALFHARLDDAQNVILKFAHAPFRPQRAVSVQPRG